MEEAVARSKQILREFLETSDENVTLEQKNLAICAATFLCVRDALKDHHISRERAAELIQTLNYTGFPGTGDLDLSLLCEAGSQS